MGQRIRRVNGHGAKQEIPGRKGIKGAKFGQAFRIEPHGLRVRRH